MMNWDERRLKDEAVQRIRKEAEQRLRDEEDQRLRYRTAEQRLLEQQNRDQDDWEQIGRVDLNNPTMVFWQSPHPHWKCALLIHLGKLFNLRTFVESGIETPFSNFYLSLAGDTISAVRHSFTDVWSIELPPVLYRKCSERFAGMPNVHLLGSGGEMLQSVISLTSGPLLLWLDTHAATELDIISRLRPDSLVLLDNVKAHDSHVIPNGWQTKFLHGVLILHAGGYHIPERF
jgi:hypothetical protein